jgi:hypothetical protein
MLLTFSVSFIISPILTEEKHLTKHWQFLHKVGCAQILSHYFIMNTQTMVLPHSTCLSVCLSVIRFEENNLWVGLLPLACPGIDVSSNGNAVTYPGSKKKYILHLSLTC